MWWYLDELSVETRASCELPPPPVECDFTFVPLQRCTPRTCIGYPITSYPETQKEKNNITAGKQGVEHDNFGRRFQTRQPFPTIETRVRPCVPHVMQAADGCGCGCSHCGCGHRLYLPSDIRGKYSMYKRINHPHSFMRQLFFFFVSSCQRPLATTSITPSLTPWKKESKSARHRFYPRAPKIKEIIITITTHSAHSPPMGLCEPLN